MPVAREQLSTAMLDYGKRTIAVIFEFEKPLWGIERSGPFRERHGVYENSKTPDQRARRSAASGTEAPSDAACTVRFALTQAVLSIHLRCRVVPTYSSPAVVRLNSARLSEEQFPTVRKRSTP